jgi:hypothetical protein
MNGASIAEPFAYRAPLFAEDIAAIYNGFFPRRSAEFIGRLSQQPGMFLANEADSALMVNIGPDFTKGQRFDGGSSVLAGNREINGNLTITGNLVAPNIQRQIVFTPTTTGWYRILTGGGIMGGRVRVSAFYDNSGTDVDFNFQISGYGIGGVINENRYSNYNQGRLDEIRVGSDNSFATYLDLHLAVTDTAGPVTITFDGLTLNEANVVPVFANPPVVGAPPPLQSNNLTTGLGIRSTSMLRAPEWQLSQLPDAPTLPGVRVTYVDGGTGSTYFDAARGGGDWYFRANGYGTPTISFSCVNGVLTALNGLGIGATRIWNGAGSPEGIYPAPVGSLFLRTDGGAGTSLYVKESGGASAAGWVAK